MTACASSPAKPEISVPDCMSGIEEVASPPVAKGDAWRTVAARFAMKLGEANSRIREGKARCAALVEGLAK